MVWLFCCLRISMNTEVLPFLLNGLGGLLVTVTAPGSVELAILTAAGLMPVRRIPPGLPALPRTAIVVPAHNEEEGIGKTLRSIQDEIAGDSSIELFVIADNCTDATAHRAAQGSATVLERHDLNQRGKGHATSLCVFRNPAARICGNHCDRRR